MNLAVRGGCLKVIRGDEHWCVLLTLPCTQGPQRAPPPSCQPCPHQQERWRPRGESWICWSGSCCIPPGPVPGDSEAALSSLGSET